MYNYLTQCCVKCIHTEKHTYIYKNLQTVVKCYVEILQCLYVLDKVYDIPLIITAFNMNEILLWALVLEGSSAWYSETVYIMSMNVSKSLLCIHALLNAKFLQAQSMILDAGEGHANRTTPIVWITLKMLVPTGWSRSFFLNLSHSICSDDCWFELQKDVYSACVAKESVIIWYLSFKKLPLALSWVCIGLFLLWHIVYICIKRFMV